MTPDLKGLYAITPDPCPDDLDERLDAALAGGARIIQLRRKSATGEQRLSEARALVSRCRHAGALAIVNDDAALAAASGAHGVHLGRDDGSIAAARALLGPEAIIGVSCYDQIELARQAEASGADYLAFGSFYTSSTKPQAARAPIELLRRAKRELHRPLVAIGGITPENGAALVEAGADMLAVIDALFGVADVAQRAEAFARLFPQD